MGSKIILSAIVGIGICLFLTLLSYLESPNETDKRQFLFFIFLILIFSVSYFREKKKGSQSPKL